MDNVRFANVLEDERKLLLLAEHLRTNPETITRDTKIELAGWKTPSSPERSIKVGYWLYSVCKRYPRRLEALEKSPNDDVKKATAEVLRLTSEFQDARRVLLLAEHLRTNPETITTRYGDRARRLENAVVSGALYQSRVLALPFANATRADSKRSRNRPTTT